jgi:hypothetical protein
VYSKSKRCKEQRAATIDQRYCTSKVQAWKKTVESSRAFLGSKRLDGEVHSLIFMELSQTLFCPYLYICVAEVTNINIVHDTLKVPGTTVL